ncbi:MAG: hypothetical protein Q9163_004138 [Psora crenata]
MPPAALDTSVSWSSRTRDRPKLPIRPRGQEQPTEKTAHADLLRREWTNLHAIRQGNDNGYRPVWVDHTNSIGLAHLVAVSRYGVPVNVEDTVSAIGRVSGSLDSLRDRLDEGHSLYGEWVYGSDGRGVRRGGHQQSLTLDLGITTGFGGSADTRTDRTIDLQRALLQHQQSGIMPVVKKPDSIHAQLKVSPTVTFMPEEWVRAAMLVRCKSLLNGYSALRYEVIEVLMTMLNENLTPLVPLRGSISASGDLQPLSYIAGAIEGNPDVWVWTDDGSGGRDLIPADAALALIKRRPHTFGPKEGLAVLNGTAFSTAVAALALHESHHLALLSQILTAMAVEALSGTAASFDAFFARVRPHKGQAEAARHIRDFISGTALARNDAEANGDDSTLKQDRYALRTASQWIGPQLEDLALAHEQISVECNSTTDNPLVNIEDDTIHHGGNFQAASVTSAMEKTRLALQMLGRMLFSQCTELINPATNHGLPPNLAADEPSTSYTFKGIDINVAAYMSELAFLANPVSSHVQTAEMGNQGINSLALVSARYTHQAIDVLSLMCASYLYALCQALDLRAMGLAFADHAVCEVYDLTYETFEYAVRDEEDQEQLRDEVVQQTLKQMSMTRQLDSRERFQQVADTVQGRIASFLCSLDATKLAPNLDLVDLMREWNVRCAERLRHIFLQTRTEYFDNPDPTPYLGKASLRIYGYIRNDLGVPFHRGLSDCPSRKNERRTVGSNASIIYEALREGRLSEVVMDCLEDKEEGR